MPLPQTTRLLTIAEGASTEPPRNFYIWGYQPHFGICVKCAAERIFKKLDDSILPDTLIVAINLEEGSNLPTSVVEPEDHDLQAERFKDVLSLAAQLEKASPSPSLGYTGDSKRGEAWIKSGMRKALLENIKKAVRQTIEGAYSGDPKRVYVSPGREFGPFVIFTVLLIDSSVYASHHALRNAQRDGYTISTSLIDSVSKRFVESCYDAILSSFDGAHFATFAATDATLRAAGENLMLTPFSACNSFGLHGGFETCAEISTLTYEKAVGRGRLIIARTGHDNVTETLSFRNPPKLRNFRAVRKLLQLAGEGEGLITNAEDVVGIGKIEGNYDSTKEDLFCVDFLGHSKWELSHAGVTLMRVEHGIPQLPKKKEQVRRFCETFARVFPTTGPKQRTVFQKIADAAAALDHGTILIVAENAKEEAERFGAQSTMIEIQPISPSLLEKASRIDGAILVSPDAMCHAIGVILDGKANDRGSAERGARYNSTVRYVLGSTSPCIGVVVSDDGMINLVPEYRPLMSKREISEQLNVLRALVDEAQVEQREMNKLMDRIKKNAFYFSEDQCKEINEQIAKAEPKSNRAVPWIVHGEFTPHPDMNETYLKD